MSKKTSLKDTVDILNTYAREHDQVQLDEIVEALNSKGIGALLAILALVIILPVGAIPGVPAVFALMIIAISVQVLMGRKRLWIPKKLGRLSFSNKRFERSAKRFMPYAKRIDRYIKPRIEFLFYHETDYIVAVFSIILAATIPVLGFVPMLATVPAMGIFFLGLALMRHDGLFLTFATITVIISVYLLFSIDVEPFMP